MPFFLLSFFLFFLSLLGPCKLKVANIHSEQLTEVLGFEPLGLFIRLFSNVRYWVPAISHLLLTCLFPVGGFVGI